MLKWEQLYAEATDLLAQAEAIRAKAEEEGREPTADEMENINQLCEKSQGLKAQGDLEKTKWMLAQTNKVIHEDPTPSAPPDNLDLTAHGGPRRLPAEVKDAKKEARHGFDNFGQFAMAVRNALLPGLSKGVTDLVPWTTSTDPEVAHVGLTEEQALERFGDQVVRTCDWPMAQVDRARTEGDTAGLIKLVHKKDGTLLGATIVAGPAGEMIHEWIVALEHGIKVGDLSNAIHVYPTYSIAGMQAAAEIRVNQLLDVLTGRVVHGLARLMR